MASTQKMILMAILFNILGIFLLNFALAGTSMFAFNEATDLYNDILLTQESHMTDLQEEEQNWFQKKWTDSGMESIVNQGKLILTFGWVFVKGFGAWMIPTTGISITDITVPEYIIMTASAGLRGLLLLLLGFEAYLVYINRKTSA